MLSATRGLIWQHIVYNHSVRPQQDVRLGRKAPGVDLIFVMRSHMTNFPIPFANEFRATVTLANGYILLMTVLQSNVSEVYSVVSKSVVQTPPDYEPQDVQRVRVMSLNVWNYSPPWTKRLQLLADIVKAADPDVIGIQELRNDYHQRNHGLHQVCLHLFLHGKQKWCLTLGCRWNN